MSKSSMEALGGKYKNRPHQEYGEMIDMIESGMQDYEIAEELGVTSKYVFDLKSKIYNDMI